MIQFSKMALAAAALLTLAACATTPEAPPPPPPPPAPAPPPPPPPPPVAAAPSGAVAIGQAKFQSNCSGCHNGAGRAPGRDVLAARNPNDIVTALTSGAMARQGAGLSADEKKAVAQFLTGKAPS